MWVRIIDSLSYMGLIKATESWKYQEIQWSCEVGCEIFGTETRNEYRSAYILQAWMKMIKILNCLPNWYCTT
jgi:hypothetical protein